MPARRAHRPSRRPFPVPVLPTIPENLLMSATVGVTGIVQLHIPCKDVARGVAFYRDVLGIPLLFEAGGLSFMGCGTVRLMLSRAENAAEEHPASITYFNAPNIQAGASELAAAGARVGEPHVIARVGDRDVWLCDFTDSEGNLMCLMEERAVAA
jgi:predicted enzyme related to lactoylglutathione lyase